MKRLIALATAYALVLLPLAAHAAPTPSLLEVAEIAAASGAYRALSSASITTGGGTRWTTWAAVLAVAGGVLLWMTYGGSSGGTGCPEPAIPEFGTTTGNTIAPVGGGLRDCVTYLSPHLLLGQSGGGAMGIRRNGK